MSLEEPGQSQDPNRTGSKCETEAYRYLMRSMSAVEGSRWMHCCLGRHRTR